MFISLNFELSDPEVGIILELNSWLSSFVYFSLSNFVLVIIWEDLSFCLISSESDNKFSSDVSELSFVNISEL